MQYINGIEDYYGDKKTAVTLGKFDGLHRGHQKLIERINSYASEELSRVMCAFAMGGEMLLSEKERITQLENQLDVLISCPFTEAIRTMEADVFIKEVLVERLQAAHVIVGDDFRFGYQKRGDIQVLEKYASIYGYCLDVVPQEMYQGREISSTYIKEALQTGDVVLANTLLGYEYEIAGVVEYGRQLGRTLGFPTINVIPPAGKFLPQFGVYSCVVEMDHQQFEGICNIGIKPTVEEKPQILAEVHLFNYTGNAYNKEVRIKFQTFIRAEKKFDSVTALKEQIACDIAHNIQI